MPIQLNSFHGKMTSEVLLKWLREADENIPEYIGGNELDTFLSNKDKTYGHDQQQDFIADFSRYYRTCRTINDSIENLKKYKKHLSEQTINDPLANALMGVREGHKLDEKLLKEVKETITTMLEEESIYIDDCLSSLEEQLKWHRSGAVDKGEVHQDKLAQALKETRPKGEMVTNEEKDKAKFAYYEPIRNKLMSYGFIVSPRGTAMGAVFPEEDWVDGTGIQLVNMKDISDKLMKKYKLIGDDNSALIRLLKPAPSELIKNKREEETDPLVSAVGCVCISWTRHKLPTGKKAYIPILGLSGVVERKPDNKFFEKYCRHLALPTKIKLADPQSEFSFTSDPEIKNLEVQSSKTQQLIKKNLEEEKSTSLEEEERKKLQEKTEQLKRHKKEIDEQKRKRNALDTEKRKEAKSEWELTTELYTNYETMMERTNISAICYRARERFGLRKPSRQALKSYVSFREKKISQKLTMDKAQDRSLEGVDLYICYWHSLNCAEPAALMCAASFFCAGSDVEVCFPYEGLASAGSLHNRPKETCPWCAAVELGFRSVSRNSTGLNTSLTSGSWQTQLTLHTTNEPKKALPVNKEFNAFDDNNKIMKKTKKTLAGLESVGLVDNKDLNTEAYSEVVQTKIGRIRSFYYLLGLIDPELVALDLPLYAYSPPNRFKFSTPWG